MNTRKLREALDDMRQQRSRMDSAISQIDAIIRTLELEASTNPPCVDETATASRSISPSYIDDTVQILHQAGKPMHMRDILEQLNILRGQKVSRNSVEASINRHVLKSKVNTKIARFGPGLYGLAVWKKQEEHPALAQIA